MLQLFAVWCAVFGAALLTVWPAGAGAAPPVFPADKPGPPGSLSTLAPPLPPNLSDFVSDKQVAIVLGKALFWDEQAGSDGLACASCHFHAGADNRVKGELSPGLNNQQGAPIARTFNVTASNRAMAGAPPGGGPNYTLNKADFPVHQLADPNDRESAVVFDSDDVVGSQGAFRRDMGSLLSNNKKPESCSTQPSFFGVGGINVRQVEPRNTPTVINAVYNYRNFWDGRANNVFNGRNPFGPRDPTAGVDPLNSILVADSHGSLTPLKVLMPDASLASQAVGPILSDFEMSCAGRVFETVGKKILQRQPLALQNVDPGDSVLGPYSNSKQPKSAGTAGLATTYESLIRSAFQPRFWSSSRLTSEGYTQMQKNFSLFWGVSIMLYESTLVSDNTPFDRYLSGDITAMNIQQVNGFNEVFMTKGGCVFCHKGPEFTGAATTLKDARPLGAQVEHMLMGDGANAVYDSGFYNIGVRPAVEDIGLGGKDPWGNPLSWSRQAKGAASAGGDINLLNVTPDLFNVFTCNFQINPCVPIRSTARDAVDGAFKTPSLRNVELTGPYFHNGGQATLEQVVDFYNRGGDGRGREPANTTGFGANPTNRAPAIGSLGLTDTDKANLVAFLKSLTDDRVRWEQAPFDHPELHVPDGAKGDQNRVNKDGSTGHAQDDVLVLPAIGAQGRAVKNLPPRASFEDGLK
jgi:cytochrome c peroxidase